jgi:dienelactone hydrolase
VTIRFFFIFALAVIAVPSTPAQTARPVRLNAADDAGITAAFYAAATNPSPGVILVHDYGKSREEWSPYIPVLQRAGFAILAIDLRGHGESTRRLTVEGPKSMDYHNFKPRDFQDMLLDVNAAYDWLTTQPGIETNRIAIVGAGLGANVAIRYGAFNDEAAAFLLFSPGFVYQEVRTDDVIGKIGARPLRIYVSQFDGFAFESSKRLIDLRKKAGNPGATNDISVCTGDNHGAAMLSNVKQLPGISAVWLQQSLAPVAPAK